MVNADASPLVPGCSLSGAVEGTAESPSEVTAVVCCGAPAREKTNQEKLRVRFTRLTCRQLENIT